MITYDSNFFGIRILSQIHGSAVYRAIVPALLSTSILIIVATTIPSSHWGCRYNDIDTEDGDYDDDYCINQNGQTLHPYTITIYVNAFSLLLTFRLNFSYQRYWEAASQLFLMISKWSDAATVLAAFHYQQEELYSKQHLPPFSEVEQQGVGVGVDDDPPSEEEEDGEDLVGEDFGDQREENEDMEDANRQHRRRARSSMNSSDVISASRNNDDDDDSSSDDEARNVDDIIVEGRGDSSGPTLLRRWFEAARGRSSRRRRSSKKRKGSQKQQQPQQQQQQQGNAERNEPKGAIQEGSEQTDEDNTTDSLPSLPTSVTDRPPRPLISTLEAVAEETAFMIDNTSKSSPSDDGPESTTHPQQAQRLHRRATMPAKYQSERDLGQQQQMTVHDDDNDRAKQRQQIQAKKNLPRHHSADELEQQSPSQSKKKSPRKSRMIQRHVHNPQFESPFGTGKDMMTVIGEERNNNTSTSGGTRPLPTTKKPKHRRVPSADVPQPWEAVYSFQNRPTTLDQSHQKHHTGGFPQSGLHHRRSNFGTAGAAGVSSSNTVRGMNHLHRTSTTTSTIGPSRMSILDARRRNHRHGSTSTTAPVIVTGLDSAPLPGVGGNMFGATHFDPAAGLGSTGMTDVGESDLVHHPYKRRRSSFQIPVSEGRDNDNDDDDGGTFHRQSQQRRSSMPTLSRFTTQISHIDSLPISNDVLSNLNGPRSVFGEQTIDTRSDRTSPSTLGGDALGDDDIKDHFFVEEDDENTNTIGPSLFVQEAAHLFSLTSTVAMASLRADMEGVASPLVEYIPGLAFPPANPDEIQNTTVVIVEEDSLSEDKDGAESVRNSNDLSRKDIPNSEVGSTSLPSPTKAKRLSQQIQVQPHFSTNGFWRAVYFLMGLSRSPRQRTLYNATRPFTVLGGISDDEVYMLQQARGPEAQMALCGLWIKEFITREYLGGSTGKVAPPIISRVYQFFSDGMTQYNQCRKIAYIQFPFPQAQLTIFFLFVSLVMFPYLYYSYVNSPAMACILNFLTVVCFVGQQEVARELQDPFYQYPNDLPLNRYQAEFNEALISSFFTGFHPDLTNHEGDDAFDDSDGEVEVDEAELNISQSMKKDQNTHKPNDNHSTSLQNDEYCLTSDEMTLISKAAGRCSNVEERQEDVIPGTA